MADSSFDVVSSVDLQEVKNAIAQAMKEITTRFDLKGTGSDIILNGEEITLTSSDEFKLKAVTDVLEGRLVKRGVPFRQSHGIVAGIVRETLASGRSLSDLTRDELKRHSEALDDGFYDVLAQQSWLESKVSEGGTSLARVREQLSHARAELEGQPA